MNRERERIRKEVFDKAKEVKSEPFKTSEVIVEPEVNPRLLRMFPPERIKRIMEKEARRYKASLKKKWDKWMEAVSR